MRRSGVVGTGRLSAWPLLPLFLIATGCSNEGDMIVVNELDCGLVREDLFRDWSLTFDATSAFLTNCDDVSYNGKMVDVDNVGTVYQDIIAFASPSGVSFDVVGSGPDQGNELMATVEADSCLALVQKWEHDDGGWVQCFGTFDRGTGAITAFCDSMDLDTSIPLNGRADIACDLDRRITLHVVTP